MLTNEEFFRKLSLTVVFVQLVIGDFGLRYEESKAQFALWSILAAVSIDFSEFRNISQTQFIKVKQGKS